MSYWLTLSVVTAKPETHNYDASNHLFYYKGAKAKFSVKCYTGCYLNGNMQYVNAYRYFILVSAERLLPTLIKVEAVYST